MKTVAGERRVRFIGIFLEESSLILKILLPYVTEIARMI